MGVTEIRVEPQAATMTVMARFDAAPEVVWRLWAEQELLERWWGPPDAPATIVEHDLVTGGRVRYRLTGPAGDPTNGAWEVLEVEAPNRLLVEDALAGPDFAPDPAVPSTRIMLTLVASGGGTLLEMISTFESEEAMQEMVGMGLQEGMRSTMDQLDALVAELQSSA